MSKKHHHSKHHHSKRRKNTQALKITAVILAFIILVCSVLLVINWWEKKEAENAPVPVVPAAIESVIEYNGVEYSLKEDVETILVLGLDEFGYSDENTYENALQADFLMLLVVDNANEKCTALHINRDTIAQMNVLGVAGDRVDTVEQQIALAHTYGNGKEVSCRNTAEAVSLLLNNVEIDHYVSVTMDSVSIYNDFVGGVEVEVLDDFTGIDETLIKGETVTLKGEHALNYVRTRYGLDDSTNNHRMERQRQYIKALYEKTIENTDNDSRFVMNAATELAPYIVSDCSINRLQELAEKIVDYKFEEICYLEGETVMGETFMEFYPDEKSVQETVVKLFYEQKG